MSLHNVLGKINVSNFCKFDSQGICGQGEWGSLKMCVVTCGGVLFVDESIDVQTR